VNDETKEHSKHWMHTHSPNKRKKFELTLSARKLMATAFWDKKGVLMGEILQQMTTITYCETLKEQLWVIENKRNGMLTYGVVLFHNARPHTAACIAGAFQLGVG
jgi:hypothetical protein